MDAPIEYDSTLKSFYYSHNCDLMIGFVDSNKVRGGRNIFKENIPSAVFLHNYDSYFSISKNYLVDIIYSFILGIFSEPFDRGD